MSAETLDLEILKRTIIRLILEPKQWKFLFEVFYYLQQFLALSFLLQLRNMYQVCVFSLFLAVLKLSLALSMTE
jgi:hypothetical protein